MDSPRSAASQAMNAPTLLRSSTSAGGTDITSPTAIWSTSSPVVPGVVC
jgi:hypothetical protein